MPENLLSLQDVAKSHDGGPLLTRVSLGVDVGDKIGLVGANGAGKSTLLRVLAGQLSADDGQVALRKGTRVTFLEQNPLLDEARTIQQVLEEALGELRACIAEYETAAAEMRDDAEALLHRIEQLGGWDYQHRIDAMASDLHMPPLDASVENLSGGERKRVALGAAILNEPDLLLLDEPTNHLDAETVSWLEAWLRTTRATCILVTHDRYFLDEVVTRLVELRDGEVRTYAGSYTDYIAARAVEEAHRERTRHRQLRILSEELAWAKRQPKARTTKSRARLERIDDALEEVEKSAAVQGLQRFEFGRAPRLGATILELEGVCASYPGQPPLIEDLDLLLKRGQRIGVLGPNGAGKTTLLRILCGEQKPTSGKVTLGKNTQVAYFDQHRASLDGSSTPKEILAPDGADVVHPPGGKPVHVASWLDRFGFRSDTHNRRVDTLSGGERNRLAIARFLLNEANLLILDEPTNDLDIPTLNLLEEAIASFEGCVIIVSHDRYLLDKVATGILAFEQAYLGHGVVTYMEGSYTHYANLRLPEIRETKRKRESAESERAKEERVASSDPSTSPEPRSGVKPLTYGERLELEALEPKVEAAEARVSEIESQLTDPEIWKGTRGAELTDELEKARSTATELFERWEALMARAESV